MLELLYISYTIMQRPWNKAHEILYSLSTLGQSGVANMNICTYVVPISMKPKMYMIALDPQTQSYQNFLTSSHAVLQILGQDCKKYITPLGRTSGKQGDKLEKYKKELSLYEGFSVLQKAAVYLYVHKREHIHVDSADHELFIVEVISYTYNNPESSFLDTGSIF